MVRTCIAPDCKTRLTRGTKLRFHRFPDDPKLCNLWLIAINREKYLPRANTSLCSLHFQPSDYTINYGYTILKEDAIPTQNLPNAFIPPIQNTDLLNQLETHDTKITIKKEEVDLCENRASTARVYIKSEPIDMDLDLDIQAETERVTITTPYVESNSNERERSAEKKSKSTSETHYKMTKTSSRKQKIFYFGHITEEYFLEPSVAKMRHMFKIAKATIDKKTRIINKLRRKNNNLEARLNVYMEEEKFKEIIY